MSGDHLVIDVVDRVPGLRDRRHTVRQEWARWRNRSSTTCEDVREWTWPV